MKSSIYKQGLTFACIVLVSTFFYGCEKGKTTTKTTSNGGEVITEQGIFQSVTELNEFDYKGHRYISSKVRDGIALAHAGHCWCNDNKK